MKKYIILALMPILLQNALLQSSDAEFDAAIAPSLQNAKFLLQNPMIPTELDAVVNGLVECMKKGSISKKVTGNALEKIHDALLAYKNKQYSNTWQWFFGQTPEIVKNKIQPALDKVTNAINIVEKDEVTFMLATAGIAIAGTAAIAGAIGGGVYLHNKYKTNKELQPFIERMQNPSSSFDVDEIATQWAQIAAVKTTTYLTDSRQSQDVITPKTTATIATSGESYVPEIFDAAKKYALAGDKNIKGLTNLATLTNFTTYDFQPLKKFILEKTQTFGWAYYSQQRALQLKK